MKKLLLILLTAFLFLIPLSARSYFSITLSPYFDGGNILWTDGNDVKYTEIGGNANLDLAMMMDIGDVISWGGTFGSGVRLPFYENASSEQVLYDYAFTPYVATTLGIKFDEKFYMDLSAGVSMLIGLPSEGEGALYFDLAEIFAGASFLYNFSHSWAFRAGINASVNPGLPIIYINNSGNSTEGAMLRIGYRIMPFAGIALTF